MSYWAIGVDIVEIQRFRAYPPSEHSRFYERVYNDYEYDYCINHSDPYPHFAGIFAGKEAVFKAASKFMHVSLSQIFIHHDEKGRPFVWLEKNDIAPQRGDKQLGNSENLEVQVSITHSHDLALAWALICVKTSRNDLLEELDRFKAELQREIGNEFVEHRYSS
ncbi:MAG: holo-ACP synthase [Candidatus Hodarchaeota archaeon]